MPSPSPSPGKRLRTLLKNGIVIAPGAYDALSARLARQAGAKAVYMTGFGISGSLLGAPDLGLVTASEMADRVRALAASCAPVPLIADGDNGHGGVLNAERLTRAYEQASAACIQIEDQLTPKRCGHMEDKQILPLAEAVAKIRAVAAARASKDFCILARTDARAVEGLKGALKRGEAFLKAGADILFIEAPRSEKELRAVADTFKGVPLVANMVEDGKTPFHDAAVLADMGYRIALFPVSALLRVSATLADTYAGLLKRGTPPEGRRFTFAQYNEAVGLGAALARAKRFDGQ